MTWTIVTFLTVLFFTGPLTIVHSFLTEENKRDIINTHNHLRREFAKGANEVVVSNMKKLTWSHHLEMVAQETLNLQCERTFVNYNRGYSLNENTDSNGNFTGDIIMWYNNITRHFMPLYHTCYPYQSCMSAYTLLNAPNKEVGCAYRTDCGNDNVFLCLYNEESTVPFYKTGPLCSKCDGTTSFCDDGLCVSCDASQETCDCRKSCEHDQIGRGALDSSTCTCNCEYGMGPNCDEPCENRQMYVDYDICAEVTQDMCNFPGYDQILQEFCPAVCHCNKFPSN